MPPLPKRSSELRRRNKDTRHEKAQMSGAVAVPGLPKDTHPIARRWYNALKRSGQSKWYEPSDWAAAQMLAAQMTTYLNAGRFVAFSFTTLWGAMGDMLTTEASRRKVRIEIERVEQQQTEAPGVTAISAFRKKAAQ